MKKKLLLSTFFVLTVLLIEAQEVFKQNYDLSIAPSHQSYNEVLLLEDGHLLFAGENTKNSENYNWVLSKRDAQGEEIWTKYHALAPYNFLNEMFATPEGGAYLIGFSRPFFIAFDKRGIVLKVDANGEEEWFEDLGIGELLGGGVLPNGNLVLAQLRADDLWAIVMNDEGTLLQEFLVKADLSFNFGGLTVTDDGGFIVFGGDRLIKYNVNFEMEWSKVYDYNGDPIKIYDLILYNSPFTDANYIMAGSSNVFGGLLTSINASGELVIQKETDLGLSKALHLLLFENEKMVVVNGAHVLLFDPYTFAELGWLAVNNWDLEGTYFSANDGTLTANGDILIGGQMRNFDAGTNALIASFDIELEEQYITMIGAPLPTADQRISSVVPTSDGGYAFVGQAYFTGKQGELTLIKTDSEGQVEWENIVGTEKNELLYSISNTSDGGLVTTGWTNEGSASKLVISRLDSNGAIIWEERLDQGSNGLSSETFCVELSDGNFALAYPLSFNKYQAAKISAEGMILWNNTFDNDLRTVTNLKAAENGGFSLLASSILSRARIVRLNSSGTVIIDVEVDQYSPTSSRPIGLEHSIDGSFLVSGTNNVINDYFIAKVTPLGNVLWINEYEVNDNYSTFRPTLTKTIDGNYMAVVSIRRGTTSSAEAAEALLLRKVDEQGNTLWNQTLGEDKWFLETCNDIAAASNGGVILAGYSRPFNNDDMMLILTEADGTVAVKNIQSLGQLSISPTPTTGPLNLQFQSEKMGEITISLMNTKGQLLRQFIEQKSTEFFEKQYQFSELPAGHYFLRLELGERSMTRSWIKK